MASGERWAPSRATRCSVSFRMSALATCGGRVMGKSFRPMWMACLVGACAFNGCGKHDDRPGRVPVTGTVLRAGQPVAEATVIFEPVGSTPAATGTTDAAGRFVLSTFDAADGAAPGEYKVAVRKVQVVRAER